MRLLRILGVLTLLAPAARGDDWAHLGLDAGRTRATRETIAAPALLGQMATGSGAVASPVASDGFLVVAGLDGGVRAYRESDRSLLWTASTGAAVLGTPLVDQGRVFVPSTGGVLRVLRLADGAALGSVPTGGCDHSSPVSSGGLVYLGSGFPNRSLVAVDPVRLTVTWAAPLDQVTQSSPALAGGKAIIATNNGTLAAFDATTGAPAWSATVGGSAGPSAPMVAGSSVFLLADGTLTRFDLGTGAATGTLSITDTPPANLLSVRWAGSSLALVGGLLAGVVRFEYALDLNGDGFVDAWTFREFAFGADPASMALVWQTPLGILEDATLNQLPAYRFVPSPVSLGTSIAFASSLDGSLRLLSSAGGPISAFTLDSPSLASPMLANARLYALTTSGRLFAFEDPGAPQPPAVTGLSPSNVILPSAPAALAWDPAGPTATYLVRISSSGDLYQSWSYQFVTSGTSVPCPALSVGAAYVWGVRIQNAALAYAPWSLAGFTLDVVPQPPGSLTATAHPGSAVLTWSASPSSSMVGYRLDYGPAAGGPVTEISLGAVGSTVVTGLTNGTSYAFSISAMDALGDASVPVTALATPQSAVTLRGVLYDSIEDALAAARPGDTVLLGAETFYLASTLEVPPGVVLSGENARDTKLVATGPVVLIEAHDGSRISLMSLSSGAVGVNASGAGVGIDHCVITGMSQEGIVVTGSAFVVNNTVMGNTSAGVLASGPTAARNNIIQQNGIGLSGSVSSTYDDVADGYSGCAAGTGDLSRAVRFLDPASGDYREQPNQPSLDAGDPADDYSLEPSPNGGRINLGAFGDTALAALSPAAGPDSPSHPASCGLLGLEVAILLVIRRRRR